MVELVFFKGIIEHSTGDNMQLPINVVPGSDPPVFRWSQLVDTPAGRQMVQHEEGLSPTVEVAVARLVSVAKQLLMDNAGLRGKIDGLTERVANLETGRSNRKEMVSIVEQPTSVKKGKQP